MADELVGPIDPLAPLEDGRRCTAHSSRTGERCQAFAIRGGSVCNTHGGATPQVKRAARRRLAMAEARKALAEVEVEEVTDPFQLLLDVIAEARAWQQVLAAHVSEIHDQYRFTDEKGAEQLDARVALYERALDRVAKFSETWLRLDLDTRLVEARGKLTEKQVQIMARAHEAYRRAAAVDPDAHERGVKAMAAVMRGA